MTIRKIAIICMIGIIACICGCLDNGDNYQYKLDQAIADRDAEWQEVVADRDAQWEDALHQAIENRDVQWENAIRQSNDQQTLDFIMQILPLLV